VVVTGSEFATTARVRLTVSRGTGNGGARAGVGTNLSIAGQWQIDAVVQEADTGADVPLRIRTRPTP
jgi:hypothetical protein